LSRNTFLNPKRTAPSPIDEMMPSGVADTQVALVSAAKAIGLERCIVLSKLEGKEKEERESQSLPHGIEEIFPPPFDKE